MISVPKWWDFGTHASGGFGYAVDGGGDVNSDWFADVLVGDPLSDVALQGRASVYYGCGESGGGAMVAIAAFTPGHVLSRLGRAYPWRRQPLGVLIGAQVPCPNGVLTRSIPTALLTGHPFTPPSGLLFTPVTALDPIDAGDTALFSFPRVAQNGWFNFTVRFLYEEGSVMGMTKTRLLHPVYGGAREQDFKIRSTYQPHIPLLLNTN